MNRRLLCSALILSIFASITIIFFFQAIFSDGQFFFGDISQNHYPARKLISILHAEGKAPLWNPYISGGQPLYANPSNLLYHPVSLLFLILPFDTAFKGSIILQYLLCAIGMYLFSKELGFSRSASILTSMAFTFSGFILSLGHLYNLLGSASWIPFFLFFFYRSIYRSFLYWPVASLFLLVIFMAADPFFITVSLLLSISIVFLKPLGKDSLKNAFKKLSRTFLIFLSTVFLSCFFLLPTLEMLMLSGRGAGLSSDIVGKWSLKGVEIFALFIPNIFGNPLSLSVSDYWGGLLFKEVIPLFLSLYMGICVLFLTTLTFFKWNRVAIIFWLLFLISIFLSLGENNPMIPSFLWKLPFFSSFRYASKFFLLSTFAASILAGRGFDHLLDIRQGKYQKPYNRGVLLIIPALMTLVLGAFYYVGIFFPDFLYDILEKLLHVRKDLPEKILMSISSKFLGMIIYAAGIGLIGTILIFISLFFRMKKGIIISLFLATVFCDLFIMNRGLNPIVEDDFYKRPSPFLEVLSKDDQWNRIYREKTPKKLMLKTSEDSKKEGFFWNRMALLQWTALPAQLLFIFDQNVDRLEPYAPSLLMKEAKRKGWHVWKKILDLSGVRYLILFNRIQDPSLFQIMEYSSMSNYPVILYRNQSSFPRVYAVPKVRIVHSEKHALREVLSDTFHPNEEAVVLASSEEELRWKDLQVNVKAPSITDANEGRVKMIKEHDGLFFEDFYRINMQTITNNDLKIMIQADQSGFLVLSDTYYPGWICSINGHESPIFKTNFIHRGVPFEKGQHIVEFHFRPRIFFLGKVISGISLIAVIFLVLFLVFRAKVDHQLFIRTKGMKDE